MNRRLAWTLAVVLLSCAGCGGTEKPKVLNIPGEPGHLYEVNRHHLYLQCIGSGMPTVIFEAGYGGDHRVWSLVEPSLERTTRVCSYDRAGLGLSTAEKVKPRRLPADQLDDLDALLGVAGVGPPYVLVGHSYGGVLAWLFTRRHADDVVGLVLVDSAHPEQTKRFRAALPPPRKGESEELRQLRETLSDKPQPVSPENVDFNRAMDKAGDPGSLGDTRLIVLTAGQRDEADLSGLINVRLRRVWFSLQDDYARRSTDSIHVIARYSPHFIQSNLGQPPLVVRAIREVVLAARADRPLRSCSALFRPPGAKCLGAP